MSHLTHCDSSRVDIALVVGGRWHDFDFARLELLRLLSAHDSVRCTVHADYSQIEVLAAADAVIAYTCDVRPTAHEALALTAAVDGGLRLLALHATNSAIDPPLTDGSRVFRTPDAMPEFSELLGNRFLAHPKIAPALIKVVQPGNSLVSGLAPFMTTDEVYVMELAEDLNVILETDITEPSPGFESVREEASFCSPVLFTRNHGGGQVLYFTLGHCRGRFDIEDLGIEDTGLVDRVAWESPEFREVLRRCIAWSVHGEMWPKCPVEENR